MEVYLLFYDNDECGQVEGVFASEALAKGDIVDAEWRLPTCWERNSGAVAVGTRLKDRMKEHYFIERHTVISAE